MKQTKQLSEPLSVWLAQQPLQPLFLKLLALCDVAALYIVDRNQQVIHWSQGAEQLSGLYAKDVTGKPCKQEYAITDSDDHKKQLIKYSKLMAVNLSWKKLPRFCMISRGLLPAVWGCCFLFRSNPTNMALPKASRETS